MRRRTTGNHFHYLQILGLFLLLLAWVGIMLSFINSDWQRSISEISLWKYATALKDKSFKKNALLVWDSDQKKNFSNIIRKLHKSQRKWRVVGYKGLWNECAYLPTSLLSSIALVSPGKVLSSEEINKIHRFSIENFNQSDKFYKILSRTKQCTWISFDKSSCLLLGIRTMVFLSIICGTLSVILGFVSVLNDYKIRSLSRFHPFIHRFRNRNALAILAGVTASLSGILALIGCWWFTLKSSSHFFVPSYQNEHDESGAIFVWGFSLLLAIGSGFTYVIGGIFLGVHLPQLGFFSYFVQHDEKKYCKSKPSRVAQQTRC